MQVAFEAYQHQKISQLPLGEGDDRTEPNMGRQRRYMTWQTKEKRRRAEAIPSPEVATIGSHSASKIGD